MAFDLLCNFTDISKFNPNNMVVVIRWKGDINLDEAFILLPIQTIEEDTTSRDSSTKKKLKIPYYGIEDILVSVRYKKNARGLRASSGQPDNFVSIDLQIVKRNVHIKLSSENAVVMGVTSIEAAIEAVECLLDTIYMTDQNMAYFRKCDPDVIERAYEYITNLCVDEEPNLGLPDSDIFIKDLAIYNSKNNNKIDEKIANILLVRAYELSKVEDLANILTKFTYSKPIDSTGVIVTTTDVCNSAYNYKLVFVNELDEKVSGVFVLKNLACAILAFKNPNVTSSSHSWASKYCNIVVSTYGVKNGKLLMTNKSGKRKQLIHRFNVSEKGSFRMWSPTFKFEAYLVHLLVYNMIKTILATTNDVYILPQPDDTDEEN